MRLSNYCTLASILAVAAAAPAQSKLSQGEILMAEGDPIAAIAGATNGGSSALESPIVDLRGNVLFRCRFVGGGATAIDDRAYMLGRTGSTLQLIVRSGQADPTGLLGVGTTLNTATGTGLGGSPRLSPTGNFLMFGCSLSGPSITSTGTAATGNNSTAILWGPASALLVLARRGATFTTPSNNQTYQFDSSFSNPGHQTTALNGAGLACFQTTVIGGDVSGTTNNVGWLVGVPSALDWVQRKGDMVVVSGGAAPGTYPIGFLGFNCVLNQLGQVLHDERFGAPATAANDNCLFIYTAGINQLVVREGDASPIAGAAFGSPSVSQGFGALGQAGFASTLTGAVTTADDNTMWIGSGNSTPQLVVREGTQATGLPTGVLIGTPNSNSSYSDYQGGSIAFYSSLTGTGVTAFNDSSLWLGRPGNLQLIAREGDPAPGFSNLAGFVSATFGDTTGSNGIQAGSVQMNDHGQIVFSGCTVTVVDGSGTNVLNSCNYCWDPTVGLQLLASSIDVYPTVAGPTVSFNAGGIQFPSGDGCPLGLNNNGDVVQRANFSTGGAVVRARIGSLGVSTSAISTTTGGTQTMQLDAGIANAGLLYIVAGTLAPTRPGIMFGNLNIPLNLPTYTNSIGVLNAQGRATANFTIPPVAAGFIGFTVSHAFGVLNGGGNIVHISRPCGVLLSQ